jgi:hypothetical protein
VEENGERQEENGANRETPSEVLKMVQKLWNRLWMQGNSYTRAE